jgi:hypothetical protein
MMVVGFGGGVSSFFVVVVTRPASWWFMGCWRWMGWWWPGNAFGVVAKVVAG